ncbi:MAG: ATP-binding protein [Candidatus Sericytochromatia bacterium]|nr:ATP-binding protein [Candidatus Sericytochromatia bacterium]
MSNARGYNTGMSEAEPTVLPLLAPAGMAAGLRPHALLGREALLEPLREGVAAGEPRCWHLALTDVLHQLELMEALSLGLAGAQLWAARCSGVLGWGEPLRAWLSLAGVPWPEPEAAPDGLLFEVRGYAKEALFARLDAAVGDALARGPLVLGLADAARCDALTHEWLARLGRGAADGPLVVLLGGAGLPGGLPLAGVLDEGPLSPALAAELAGGAPEPMSDEAWRGSSAGRLALRRWVMQHLGGLPHRPDDGVRELQRAVAMLGGWVSLTDLAAVMAMPEGALDELLARASAGGWLLSFAGGLGLTADAEVSGILAELSRAETMRWHRRIAAAASRPPLGRLQAAVAGGVEGLTVALGLRAAQELLPVGGEQAWAVVVREALAEPGLAEEGASRLQLGLALLEPELGALWPGTPADVPEAGWLEARRARLAGQLEAARALLEGPATDPLLAVLQGREVALIAEAEGRWAEALAALASLLPDVGAPTEVGRLGCLRALLEGDLARVALWTAPFNPAAGPAAADAAQRLQALGQDQAAAQLWLALGSWALHHERWGLADRALGHLPASLDHVWALLCSGAHHRALVRLEEVPLGGALEPVARALASVCQQALGLAGDPRAYLEAAREAVCHQRDDAWAERLTGLALEVTLHLGCFRELIREPGAGPADAQPTERLVRAEAAARLGEVTLGEQWLSAPQAREARTSRPATAARDALVRAFLARVRGAMSDGAAWLDEAEELAALTGVPGWLAEVAWRRGEHHLACQERPSALAAFAEALRLAEAAGGPLLKALAFGGVARATDDPAARSTFAGQAAALLHVLLAPLAEAERADFLAWRERAEALRLVKPDGEGPALSWEVATSLGGAAEHLLRLLGEGPTPEEVGGHACTALCQAWGATRAELHLEPGDRVPLAEHGEAAAPGATWEWEELREAVLAAGWLEQQVVVGDGGGALRGSEALGEPHPGWRLVALPLPMAGRAAGALALVELPPGGGLEVDGLGTFCQRAGLVLSRAMVDAAVSRKAARSSLLTQLHQALAGTLDVDALLRQALAQVLAIFQGEQAFVFVGADQACRASLDHAGGRPDPAHTSRTVRGRVMAERRPVTILDVGQDQEAVAAQSLMLRNVRSVMCVPLVLADDLLGMLYVSSSTVIKTFSREDLDVLGAIASHLALLLQNAQAFETIRDLNQGLEAKVAARTQELEAAMLALRDTQAQLLETEKLATVGTLAAGVAHEINNPLGAVLVNAQLLRREVVEEEQRESVDLIEQGARRCQEIVQALLAYARPTPVERQAIDLGGLVRDSLRSLATQPRVARLDLSVALQPVPLVAGDVGELRHLLNQLVLNAVDAVAALPDDTAALRVRVLETGDGVVLEVADNGEGMTPEVSRRVFDPFFTTKAVGAGKGLGLSLCRRIVEKHGGNIALTSEPGEGTLVRVVLPKG